MSKIGNTYKKNTHTNGRIIKQVVDKFCFADYNINNQETNAQNHGGKQYADEVWETVKKDQD